MLQIKLVSVLHSKISSEWVTYFLKSDGFIKLKLSASNPKNLDLDSSHLHYNTQDSSSGKITPENIEPQIKL
jgi:hypothetical protein